MRHSLDVLLGHNRQFSSENKVERAKSLLVGSLDVLLGNYNRVSIENKVERSVKRLPLAS
jgi:hypothetical protein